MDSFEYAPRKKRRFRGNNWFSSTTAERRGVALFVVPRIDLRFFLTFLPSFPLGSTFHGKPNGKLHRECLIGYRCLNGWLKVDRIIELTRLDRWFRANVSVGRVSLSFIVREIIGFLVATPCYWFVVEAISLASMRLFWSLIEKLWAKKENILAVATRSFKRFIVKCHFIIDSNSIFELLSFIASWIYAFDGDTSQDGPKKWQCFCNCDSDQRSEKIRVWNDNIALFYNSFCHALFHVFSSNSIVVVTNCCFAIVR